MSKKQKSSRVEPAPVTIIKKPPVAGQEIQLIAVKHRFRLYVFKDGKAIKAYPIAVGRNIGDKRKVGDCRTPEGDFYIDTIRDSSGSTHDFGDGRGEIPGAYGPWYLNLYTGRDRTRSGKIWTGIGIHGTHAPESIGTLATEGCLRLRNRDIAELRRLVSVGTPVSIVS